MPEIHRVPRLEMQRVEDPEFEPVSKGLTELSELGRADQFKLIFRDGNGASAAYQAPRYEMRAVLMQLRYQLDSQSSGPIVSEVHKDKVPRPALKRVEGLAELGRADQFELVFPANGGFVAYSASRHEMAKVLTTFLNRLDLIR